MPIPVYSVLLWELLPGYSIPGPQFSPPVPSGFTWIIREATAYNESGANDGHGIPRLVLYAESQGVWSTPFNGTARGQVYRLTDVRVNLPESSQMNINVDDSSWSLRVSGFQLSNKG